MQIYALIVILRLETVNNIGKEKLVILLIYANYYMIKTLYGIL